MANPFIGIRQFFRLAANQVVAASTVLVTATGFVINLAAGQKCHVRFAGGFTLGATGGFKFELLPSSAAASYVGVMQVTDTVTPAILGDVLTAAGSFANALAVAGSHILFGDFDVIGNAAASTLAFQFACNSAANSITLLEGFAMDVVLL